MGRRKRYENPISLFSFQDIVTSVTGILILMAILLAISVITQKSINAESSANAGLAEGLISEIQMLKTEVTDLDARAESNRQSINQWAGYSPEQLLAEENSLKSSLDAIEATIRQNNLDLSQMQADYAKAGQSPEIEKYKADKAKMDDALEELQTELQNLNTSDRVIYNFNRAQRQPWLAQVDSKQIVAAKAGAAGSRREFGSVSDFLDFCESLPDNERYIVLILKPTGILAQRNIREQLHKKNIDVGVELIGETQTAIEGESK